MLNIWKSGLPHVFKALDCARLSHDIFVMGGGTTLMYFFNHRLSKDIDVFLDNPQHLNFFLPSLNGYLENIASDYSHLSNFIKIKLENHEIDFIVAKNITGIKPEAEIIDSYRVPMDRPIEIIAKKIFYRHESFTIRDVFDLAMVYNSDAPALVSSLSVIDENIFESLAKRIRNMAKLDMARIQMKNIDRLAGSKNIDGQEFSLCIEFVDAMCSHGKSPDKEDA